jgi:type IV pilus assembly protein PilQ
MRRDFVQRAVRAVLIVGLAVPAGAIDSPPANDGGDLDLQKAVAETLGLGATEVEGTPVTDVAETAAAPTPTGAQHEDRVARVDTDLLDVHVRERPIATVLEMLSYEAQANIVCTTSVSGSISANLYGVTLEEALDAILTPNNYAYRHDGKTIFVGTAAEIVGLLPPPTAQVFRLRFITPEEAAQAVAALLSEAGTVVESTTASSGGGGGSEGDSESTTMGPAGGDYLIVTDYPERLDAIGQLLEQIDVRPRQVLIESTVLRATLNETNEFGIDFTMLGGVDFENVGGGSTAGTNLTLGALPAGQLQDATVHVSTDFAGNVSAGGFTFGLIRDSIAGFLRALEDITDVVVVANPKIVALNKQEAQVIVGRRDGYLTTTVTETAAVQTVEFLETGTQIRFRPLINDDGTVRLSVHPKDSNGGLTAANLPFEETTEAHADILVDDGDTVLIGGLFRERTVNSRSQLPVLGDIPGAGLLFGSRSDQTIREEVIILLTVHVLKDTAEEQAQFAQLIDDVERMRVGIRRGLLGTGRERLGQAFFQEALRRAEAGQHDLALLNVRMALHNQPKHVPAIRLRERLEQRRLWENEGTRMRTFIWELIEHRPTDRVTPSAPLFGRPEISLDAENEMEQPS